MLKRPDIVALSSLLLEHVSLLKLRKTTYHKAMKVARNKPSIVRKLTSNETESHNVSLKKLKMNLWKHGKKDYRPKYSRKWISAFPFSWAPVSVYYTFLAGLWTPAWH